MNHQSRHAKAAILALTLALSACAAHIDQSAVDRNAASVATASPTNNQREARDHFPPCFPREQIKNGDTPLALNLDMLACAERGEFEQALFLYALGGAYGDYDALRVVDPSAHDAAKIVRILALRGIDVARRGQFTAYVISTFSDKARRQKTCDEVLAFGPPTYFPKYMIDHGIQKGLSDANMTSMPNRDLVENFDSTVAWKAAVNEYLQCSES